MKLDVLTLILSGLTIAATAINVYVSLRLAAMHAKMQAENAALELNLLKQFVSWKDELIGTINGKYVSATLIAEIKGNLGQEMTKLEARLIRIEERCERRHVHCPASTEQ